MPTKVELKGTTGTMGTRTPKGKKGEGEAKPGETGKPGKDKQKTLLAEAKSWLAKVPKELTTVSQAQAEVGLGAVQRKMPACFVAEYRTLLSKNVLELKALRTVLEDPFL